MYVICSVLRVHNNFKVFHSLYKRVSQSSLNHRKILLPSTRFPIDNIGSLNKDVLLYTFNRSKFYKYLSIFGIAQFTVWSFYAGMMYVNMKDISNENLEKYDFFSKSPIWKHALGKSNGLIIAVAFCVVLGVLSTAVCTVLPSRLVKELILCKGGKSAILVTYGPFGNSLRREVPLKNLSCVTSRTEAKSYLALKVKPKWFYYLVDIRGQFHEPKLFDYTIGTRASKAY